MRQIPVYLIDVAFVLPFILGVESVVKQQVCYQCEVTDLALCTDKYLLPCPDDQRYDSCLTRISKTKNDGFWIQKKCALRPCSLRDESQSTGLGLDHCDRSQDEFDCISCCREDGCNTGGGAIYQPEHILIYSIALILTYFKRADLYF